ncbi:3-hydroxyisobutyrate dehydrogenase [Kocuria sp. cx-116]|uniref:3-hydroxyisobutyrate dehydrogenase n=1 Tax=Kocuria sp. cx-116 TaxID=2771378 RepID=UPI001682A8BB|nr:3-hydroxyisobutyrate dehydrogenase [Kocuria sp. cx-116]MBD2761801.1 3-hydroxyisobutyrate dehydrogenase [Kocuria sp. cx-116]
MTTISWIGLGRMGGPMSANLVKAGHDVRGFDLIKQAMVEARSHGVTTCDSIEDVLDGAQVVFTMLPKGEHSRAVYLGDRGVLALAPKNALLIDSSTIDVETAVELHKAAAGAGFDFVDAPVSGGISGAAAGTLTFMVGGETDTVEKAKEFIDPMAGRIVHTGEAGTGQAAKIVNNMMLFISLEACAEGSVLADRLGLDPQVFWDIASVSSGNSWALQTWYPVPGIVDSAAANNNFKATFSAALAAKDAGLALAAGEQTGVDLPAARLAAQRFEQLITEGYENLDCSLIAKYAAPDGKIKGWNPEQA